MAQVTCSRCGATTEGLTRPPLSGRLGQDVAANVCLACWRDWTQESINVINHTGLQPVDPADRQRLYGIMRDYLKLPSEVP